MHWSRYYLYTTREVPSDAEVVSQQLMVRAGMLKKLAAGIYTYQPFGWRSMTKLMAIVRREMDRTGSLELHMPAVQPAELWQETGRWDLYGHLLLRMEDRHERQFCFGPTHEEVVTDMVRRELKSYRQLPVSLYQIQTKFRDEIRPRFGLMRGREFLMKDAYSFHVDATSLDWTYQDIGQAYCRIFEACGLEYSMVEADSGTIGGATSHEFMVLAETGEDAVVRCQTCGYAANVEKAETTLSASPASEPQSMEPLKEVSTPGMTAVEQVAQHLEVTADRVVKTLIYATEDGLAAVLIRGDREVNEVKLGHILGVKQLSLAGAEDVGRLTGAPVGFAGPVGLPQDLRLVADESVRSMKNFVTGANKADAHLTGVNWDRDTEPPDFGDLLRATSGDPCVRCDGRLKLYRGIEVGHIFKLGTRYSESMSCTFSDEKGENHPMTMGCYGLGVGRTLAAAIEQHHDEKGIIWPLPLAPFHVLLIALNPDDQAVRKAADALYESLIEKDIEVLYDDRNERPGVKFNDADLIGIPIRIVVGARSLAEGQVEISRRVDREKHLVAIGEVIGQVGELLTS